MTPDSYSEQATKMAGQDYEMLRPYDHYGRRRVHFFDYTVPSGGEADGNTIFAAKIPTGARILGGTFVTDGLGTDAQVNIGLSGVDDSGYIDSDDSVADDFDLLGAAIDVEAAGADAFASTIAENYGYVTEKACWLVLTVENAAWDEGAVISGDIEIAVD